MRFNITHYFGPDGPWNKVSWLAQARGPGKSKKGLGAYPRNLSPSATTLDVEPGDSLFQDSWKRYWTLLGPEKSTGGSSNSHESNAATSTASSNMVCSGDIAGVVVGAVVVIAIVAALTFLILQRRRRSSMAVEVEGTWIVIDRSPSATGESPVHQQLKIDTRDEAQELPGRTEP